MIAQQTVRRIASCSARAVSYESLHFTSGTEHIIYIYVLYHRTLSALQNDELPTLEPGTSSRISARFMAPGQEIPRARRWGAPRAGGRSPRPSGDVCAEPLPLEGSPETRGVPSSGAGPSQNGTCLGHVIGRKIRAGRSTVIFFSVRQDPSLYNAN